MAAFMRHVVFKTGPLLSTKNLSPKCYSTKAEKRKGIDRKVGPRIDSTAESLAAKGFLRAQNEYFPPADVKTKLDSIFTSIVGNTDKNTKITALDQRFKLFEACFKEFKHCIPNSQLHLMETLGDVKRFYLTPIDVRTPLDKMKSMELPPNLHIEFEYHRFHPETDTMFNGQTAFNKSSTLVTGLKYREKYAGHFQEDSIQTSS